ncbi:hypothetical protein SLEP1_g44943 [Rubroshorea leprosula]|uniref:Uncharacterized protein n=1 Tax=Rubroshorea leprosula TaxID=152421 RepID=A0AAV5LI54_9ROSI|nr:hypothetical protein SLEP1_g44943 [Rubroshorea leprosula]
MSNPEPQASFLLAYAWTEVDGLRVEQAYFRGRKLQGSTICLPHGYSGFVLGKKSLGKKRARVTSEGNPNCWETGGNLIN